MRRHVFAALLLCCAAEGSTADNAVAIPNSPAGQALRQWLDAFNSGKEPEFESFQNTHAPWLRVDEQMQLRKRNGGYELSKIDQSERFWITFRAKEKTGGTEILGKLIVRSYDPAHITLLSLEPPAGGQTKVIVHEDDRNRVIDSAADLLRRFYVFPDVGNKVANSLEQRKRHGTYRNITDAGIFAVRLTDDLVQMSGDKHIAIDFFAEALPRQPPITRPHAHPEMLRATNCGFEKAEHFPSNIGYLAVNFFGEPDYCAPTAIAALNFLSDSDALIIDLRENRGGAPRMTAVISSYLFDEPTQLADFYDRAHSAPDQLWTVPELPGKKLSSKPIVVLTSSKTFSAAEQFCFDLKRLKRATLVGETTGGGAHAVAPHQIDQHFFIRVPFGRFADPATKADWEGAGVAPDIKVSAADALDVAKKFAAERIGTGQPPPHKGS